VGIIAGCEPVETGRCSTFDVAGEKGVPGGLPVWPSIRALRGVELVLEEIDGPLLEVSDEADGAGWISAGLKIAGSSLMAFCRPEGVMLGFRVLGFCTFVEDVAF
jgi:hypothetical protein